MHCMNNDNIGIINYSDLCILQLNKYFELKNSWGARAPLNLELLASNYPIYVQ